MALDLLTQYHNQLGIGASAGAPLVVLHPKLRGPVRCENCGSIEVLPLAQYNGQVMLDVPSPFPGALNLLPFERPSCFSCVKGMYQRTGHAALVGRGGDTPLHLAARCSNLRALYHLIVLLWGGGAHHERAVHAVTMRNDNGETALHTAVSAGSIEIVELLLWMRPQLVHITCSNISPMYLAVSLGHRDIAKALYNASRRQTPTDISYSGPNSQNALHAAALLKLGDMTQMILSWNNDLAKEKDEKGRRPIHFAVSVPQRRFIGLCCFHFFLGERGSVRELLEADSSMAYEMDNEGLYPVHVAAQTDEWFSIDVMLKKCPGCIDLRDNQGRTFLHVAVQNNAVDVVKRVCRNRRPEFLPILNIQDKNGNTALHLAADLQNLHVLCILLKNPAVLLNLRNKKDETARDVAKRRVREGFFFEGNIDKLIYETLRLAGAQHGCFLWDILAAIPDKGRPASSLAECTPAEDLEKEESAKLADSTRTLGIGSVLIASVTFSAALARVPGVSGAGSGSNQPRSWLFDAFMVANALAFICAACATVGLMYSGMALITLNFRRRHFNISVLFASYSVTCLTAAFALGVYMVLAPVARAAAITICALCPLVVIYNNSQILLSLDGVLGALRARLGFLPMLITLAPAIFLEMLVRFWPVAVIFAWASYSFKRQH